MNSNNLHKESHITGQEMFFSLLRLLYQLSEEFFPSCRNAMDWELSDKREQNISAKKNKTKQEDKKKFREKLQKILVALKQSYTAKKREKQQLKILVVYWTGYKELKSLLINQSNPIKDTVQIYDCARDRCSYMDHKKLNDHPSTERKKKQDKKNKIMMISQNFECRYWKKIRANKIIQKARTR